MWISVNCLLNFCEESDVLTSWTTQTSPLPLYLYRSENALTTYHNYHNIKKQESCTEHPNWDTQSINSCPEGTCQPLPEP